MRHIALVGLLVLCVSGCTYQTTMHLPVYGAQIETFHSFELYLIQSHFKPQVVTRGLLAFGDEQMPLMSAENIEVAGKNIRFVTPFGVVGKFLPIQWEMKVLEERAGGTILVLLDNLNDQEDPREYVLSMKRITRK
jgi:hypothetical protein